MSSLGDHRTLRRFVPKKHSLRASPVYGCNLPSTAVLRSARLRPGEIFVEKSVRPRPRFDENQPIYAEQSIDEHCLWEK